MDARRVALTLALTLAVASGAVAQEAPQELTGRRAEVAAAVESLAKALMAGDLDGLKQALRVPLLAVMVSDAAGPRIEDVTDDVLTPEAAAAAAARYGLAKQVRFVQPTVVPLAFNVAAFVSGTEWLSEAGAVLVDDRLAALLAKDTQGWRLRAVIAGDVQDLQPDEATRAEIGATLNGVAKAIIRQDQDTYVAAYNVPAMDVSPERGVRRLGVGELQAEFRLLTYMLADAVIADAAVDTQYIAMLGPSAACAIGTAKGFAADGTQIGYRPQAALLVKEAGKWKIVAQAAGLGEEGKAPESLPGLPTAE